MTRVFRAVCSPFRRPTLSPALHLRAQISHLHCPRHRRRRTDIQGFNGGKGSTAAGGRRACAFAIRGAPPGVCSVLGAGGRTLICGLLQGSLC